ncbi:hypothetical protein [Pelagibacterium montanilacus]|uniref:hypothetical protein n=1 Tax=Pelagibacterium montanilacus TaxID=2185280 RepID=UPI000F8F6E8C|nr:hypothetical protein [Pelagibacterium montanilacus]
MSGPGRHWDPFGRAIAPQRDAIKPPRNAIAFPAWLTPVLLVLAIGGIGWMIVAAVFLGGGEAVLVPAVLIGAAGGAVILVDTLGKGQQSRLYRYFRAAEALGWSYRIAPTYVQGAPGLAGTRKRRPGGGGAGGKQVPAFMAEALEKAEVSKREAGAAPGTPESELQAVYKAIPELFAPRPGQPVAMTIEAEFWGETEEAIPFWMGVREMEMNTTFAARELKTDHAGQTGDNGALLMMVAAYRLDRDTGIRATLLAEAIGDSRKDIKTESAEFNARYHIAARGTGSREDETAMAVLQALTPATQTTLLDLWDRYRMQAIIDGRVVHVSGYERINTRDPEILAQRLGAAAERFAAAATGFKRYVE